MIREIVSRVTAVISERRHARKKLQVPMKVWIEPEAKSLFKSPHRDLFLSGETYDVSVSGVAFLVSSIRIKEDYLVAPDRYLKLELDVSGKKIKMRVIGRRYERVAEIDSSVDKYLIGAEIISMDIEDRRSFEYFMKYGNKLMKTVAAKAEA
jgi:hypothetical protein